jgi:hypothetical protein
MKDAWVVQFADRQMDRAWLNLRVQLADRLAAGLATGAMEPIDISTPAGETLSINADEKYVVIVAGEDIYATANVDEAAHTVFRILHDDWQVIHPAFLDSELIDLPSIDDGLGKAVVPALSCPESREQLHSWVNAALSDWIGGPIKIAPNGSMPWRTPGRNRVVVEVRNAGRIEILAVLGRRVGFKKTHKIMDQLSRKWFGVKFFLVQDTLVMSQTVIAHPFAAEQLTTALRTFMSNRDELGWVAEKVLSRRARDDRAAIQALKRGHEEAQKALAEAVDELGVRAGRIEAAEEARAKMAGDVEKAQVERDEARAELAKLKEGLERALGQHAFRAGPYRGEAA